MTEVNNHAAVGILQSERDTALAHAERLASALTSIQAIAAPGQELSISDAIDALCDCWNETRTALAAYNAWRLA